MEKVVRCSFVKVLCLREPWLGLGRPAASALSNHHQTSKQQCYNHQGPDFAHRLVLRASLYTRQITRHSSRSPAQDLDFRATPTILVVPLYAAGWGFFLSAIFLDVESLGSSFEKGRKSGAPGRYLRSGSGTLTPCTMVSTSTARGE